MSTMAEDVEALSRRVATIEEREQMPLAYQTEAKELAAALDRVQLLNAERLNLFERRQLWLLLPWWKRIITARPA